MFEVAHYDSPLGQILIAADSKGLVGTWLEGQKYHGADTLGDVVENVQNSHIAAAIEWLNRYFAGEKPPPQDLSLCPRGSEFRQIVWEYLCAIPYGRTTTYGELSRQVADRLGQTSMSSQAVGGAVGHNPLSIVIPCHRVLAADGSLTGYAGGLEAKRWLLSHEGALTQLAVPIPGLD